MTRNRQIRQIVVITLLILGMLIALTFANIAFSRQHPGGFDFLTGWVGTRSFLLDGKSPYSSDTTLKIQQIAFGQAVLQGQEQLQFVLPLYSMAVFAPFSLVNDYVTARSIWMTLLEAGVLGTIYLSTRLVRKRKPLWLTISLLVLAIFSYQAVQPLIDGNIAVLVTLFLLAALLEIKNHHYEISGILLALSMIKPTLSILLVLFILIWTLTKKEKTPFYWFLGSMIILVGFSFLLIPDWIVQNLRSFLQFMQNMPKGSPGGILESSWGAIGMRLSVFLTVLVAGWMLLEWRSAFNGNEDHFLWTGLLTLVLAQWVGIPTKPGNFVLLLPGMLFSLTILWSRWKERARFAIFAIEGVLLIGGWILYTLLPRETLYTVLFFVFPPVIVVLLYWIKWWTLKPAETNLEW